MSENLRVTSLKGKHSDSDDESAVECDTGLGKTGKFMDISSLKNFSLNNFNQINQMPLSFGLKMNVPLEKDTISFKSQHKYHFDSKASAIEYYKKIGQEVNSSLNDEDDLTAFETLNYSVESDFETDEITINGDYKPFFEVTTGKAHKKSTISYEEAGIDQERLLQNVKKITGTKFVSSSFVPDDNFRIDKTMVYPKQVETRLEKILEQRALLAKEAISNREYDKALNILGYETDTDENGNITIKGDYTPVLLIKEYGAKTLDDYNVSENDLLSRVAKIEGNATFSKNFTPTHYIEAQNVNILSNDYEKTKEIKNALLYLNPEFQRKLDEVKKSLQNNDAYKALSILGYHVSKEGNGKTTINGSYYSNIGLEPTLFSPFSPNELGINEEALLADVSKINGDMVLISSSVKKLNKDTEVTGRVIIPNGTNEEEFFENFISQKSIASVYGIDEQILTKFVEGKALNPSVKTSKNNYFNAIDGENKAFLDSISERRDEILTTKELQEKYGVSEISIRNAVKNGFLTPYGMKNFSLSFSENAKDLMFDTVDPNNAEGIKKLEKNGKLLSEKTPSKVSEKAFSNACDKYSVKPLHENSTKAFHCEDLERLGYGSKAELIANCGLRANAYKIKQQLLECDVYDISSAAMTDILLNSRHNNPACVKLSELQRKISPQENKDYFKQGVIDGKMSIITENPYRLTNRNDYMVDLSDEKNAEFLQTIESGSFRSWLFKKFDEIEAYRRSANEELEAFLSSKAPTPQEEAEENRRKLEILQEKRRQDAINKKQQTLIKQQEAARNTSLRSTIAWVLCPNTRKIKKEFINSHIQTIFKKYDELKEIEEQLLVQEITLDEANERIKALNLSKQDEIDVLSYHKMCWDISGTKEWSNALKQATEIAKQYDKEGLAGIENPEVKERLIRWENESKYSYRKI